jgi:hypothetical protein
MFFTHTCGYRIGTCVIGFVCTEKTAKAPAAIGGIYFLRCVYSISTKSIAGQKTPDESHIYVGGAEKPGKTRKTAVVNLGNEKRFKIRPGPAGAQMLCILVVSPDIVRIRFSPGSPSTRYPVFGDGRARAR